MKIRKSQAAILIKATPHPSAKYGESICCAGIDPRGDWRRLYPINYRALRQNQQFNRWDMIEYDWISPQNDRRQESNRVQTESIRKVCRISAGLKRNKLLQKALVNDLKGELKAGKTLALIEPEFISFSIREKSVDEIKIEQSEFDLIRRQSSLFRTDTTIPIKACPYSFHYEYRHNDKVSKMSCRDWETTATFFNQARNLGSTDRALAFIENQFGKEYPEKGMVFALGTHSRFPDTWLLNAVIRYDAPQTEDLFT